MALLACGTASCAYGERDALVGAWQSISTAEDSAAFPLTYTFDGAGRLDIAWMRPVLGDTMLAVDYFLDRDSILTLSDKNGSEQFIAHVRGEVLTLRSSEGDIEHYRRVAD